MLDMNHHHYYYPVDKQDLLNCQTDIVDSNWSYTNDLHMNNYRVSVEFLPKIRDMDDYFLNPNEMLDEYVKRSEENLKYLCKKKIKVKFFLKTTIMINKKK